MRAYVWVMMRAYVVQWRAHSNKVPKRVCAQGVVMRAYVWVVMRAYVVQ